MVACLQLGAADYMIKPLRHNELRNLWARVYWWRRVSLGSYSLPLRVRLGDILPDTASDSLPVNVCAGCVGLASAIA